jgi:hypothetical protein
MSWKVDGTEREKTGASVAVHTSISNMSTGSIVPKDGTRERGRDAFM